MKILNIYCLYPIKSKYLPSKSESPSGNVNTSGARVRSLPSGCIHTFCWRVYENKLKTRAYTSISSLGFYDKLRNGAHSRSYFSQDKRNYINMKVLMFCNDMFFLSIHFIISFR